MPVMQTEATDISVDEVSPAKRSIAVKSSYPSIKVHIPLSVTTNDLFKIFQSAATKHNFQVIEADENIATAVNKEPFSFKKMLARCFPANKHSEDMISAVRMLLAVNDQKGCRKVTLKGLYGDYDLLRHFVSDFKVRLHSLVQEHKPIK